MTALRVTLLLCVAMVCGFGTTRAVAQKGPAPPPAGSDSKRDPIVTNSPTVNLGNLADPEKVRREVEQAQKEAVIERQKRIEKDTLKLLKLAAEFKAEVDGLKADQYSPAIIRKLEQIEKLAHDVRERTRKK